MDNLLTHSLSNTEVKILDAAKKIFIKKGFDGASMQDIAKEAGINKSLLLFS
ncbi:MAG TPA: helix-turn-helix domain-containing protein [Bacteroidales bacterium]|nr:helix-turn-helix domain-containing protein [Bacteroidales bacterium]